MSNLQQRLTVSTIGVIFLALAIYFSMSPYFQPVFAMLVAAAIGCAIWEYYQIAIAKGYSPLVKLGITSAVFYVLATFFSTRGMINLAVPQVVMAVFLLIFCIYYLFREQNPLINLALTIFGTVYLTLTLSLMINITYFFGEHSSQDGRWWLFYLLTVTKMTDTGAYFFGKLFGTKKFAPHISPKKTVEGAIGGMVFSVGASFLFSILSTAYPDIIKIHLTLFESIWLGTLIGAIAQVGDLVESLLKRDGGIKDSNQLPGLGGMLDIVDSLIFTAPIVYFFLRME